MNYLLVIITKFAQNLMMGTGIHISFSNVGIFFLDFPAIINLSIYTLAIAQRDGFSHSISLFFALIICLITSFAAAAIYNRVTEDSFAVIGLASILATEALAKSLTITNGVLGISGISKPPLISTITSFTFCALAIALAILSLDFIISKTPLGRQIRAFKEDPINLQASGVNSKKTATISIIISSLIFSLGGAFILWQVQFIEPGFGGLTLLIEVLTIGIIALKPQTRYIAIGTAFVTLLPEVIRFLNLPSTTFGHLRIIIYSTSLVIFIKLFQDKLAITKRSI